MKKLFNGLALLVAVTCLVWVAVLWRWQHTSRDMSVEDIVLYLGLLPLVVIGLILMLRWAWRGARARQLAQAAAVSTAGASGGAATAESAQGAGDAAQRHVAHAVWLAATCTPGGASTDELLSAAKDQDPRPRPDGELVDDDGLPVMCARIADLPVEGLTATLAPVLQAVAARLSADEPQPTELDAGVLRALAALQTPLQEAAAALPMWQGVFMEDDAPGLHVLLGVPAAWTPFERLVAQDWIKLMLTAEAALPPAARLVLQVHAEGGEALWLKADQTLMLLAQQQRRGLVLALAAHSDLSGQGLARLAQAGRLFHPQRQPKGHMPGEAAAALLLASQGWPLQPPDADDAELAPLAWLHRPALARRGKSIDDAGKVDAGTLAACIEAAQSASRLDVADLASLVCDADQHTPRGTELFSITLDMVPALDPNDDMRLTGTVCAGAGAATALTVIAGACAQAQALGKPVLAACLGDAVMRLALVARPDAPTPGQAAAPQAMPLAA